MKTILLPIFGILFFTNILYAQVGIGNTAPKSVLDIQASNQSNPSNTDGILIPRIDSFPSTDPGADQDGMLVFLTTDNTFYFWEDTASSWVPLTSDEGDNHYVGELWGGGIVFYTYQNGEHGLIASLDDLGPTNGVEWGLDGTDVSNSDSNWDGGTNTASIIAAGGSSSDAAGRCNGYSNDGFTDWYLPSILELKIFYESAFVVEKVLNSDGNPSTNGINALGEYWSSTQNSSGSEEGEAYRFKFQNGHTDSKDKSDHYIVRAVRSF